MFLLFWQLQYNFLPFTTIFRQNLTENLYFLLQTSLGILARPKIWSKPGHILAQKRMTALINAAKLISYYGFKALLALHDQKGHSIPSEWI